MTWTAAQRAVAASLLFLASAVLAGIVPVEHGVEYHLFGLAEGVFALMLAYVLVLRGAWAAPAGVCGWLAVVYGTAYQLTLDSEPGRGTSARIEVPELVAPEQITA